MPLAPDISPQDNAPMTLFDEHIITNISRHLYWKMGQIKSYSADEGCLLGYIIGYYTGLGCQGSEQLLTEAQNMLKLVKSLENHPTKPPLILEHFLDIAISEGVEWKPAEKVYA